MEYILGFIIAVLAFFLIGYFFKKKRYGDIDQLEEWKLNIMNRPVLEELTKVKQLNMTGETEVLFEKWRNEWDEIVTVELPDVEELLFDAEEYIDKYRFNRSKEVQNEITGRLEQIDADIERIIGELNDLVGSEEKNRLEIEEEKENYRVVKKQLLAHRHSFGRAADQLELRLEDIISIFAMYDEATGNGNYLKAREYVLKIKSEMKIIKEKMKKIPELLIECHTALPNQVAEIKEGYKEMIEKGYILNHFDFEKEAEQMEKKLEAYMEFLDQAEVDEVEKGIEDLKDSMSVLYEMYEKEVDSRLYYSANEDKVQEQISALSYESDRLKVEVTAIQSSYHIADADMKILKSNEKQIGTIGKQFEQLKSKVENQDVAYSILSDSLKEMEQLLLTVKTEHEVLAKKIRDLRKDENEARGKIKKLQSQIQQSKKWLVQHNVPGVPELYTNHLNEAKVAIQDVLMKLEEKPLDMAAVQIFLEKANQSVGTFSKLTKEIIEHMLLAEKVIQYTNRYRSRYPSVQAGLQAAENKFRQSEFEDALEEAAAVLEEIEPGVIKEMHVQLNYEEAQ